jgi:hypothetical protein
MEIDVKTAQLILDAIAFMNKDWFDAMEWDYSAEEMTTDARADFIRFCEARGIKSVTVSE